MASSDSAVSCVSAVSEDHAVPQELPVASATEFTEKQQETVTLAKKLDIPFEEFPDYNFIGRLLGPRGATINQLEEESGCEIAIRGRRLKPYHKDVRKRSNCEVEKAHILITVTDFPEEAERKMERALQLVTPFLDPQNQQVQELHSRQLRHLASIRRESSASAGSFGSEAVDSPPSDFVVNAGPEQQPVPMYQPMMQHMVVPQHQQVVYQPQYPQFPQPQFHQPQFPGFVHPMGPQMFYQPQFPAPFFHYPPVQQPFYQPVPPPAYFPAQ